MKVVVDDKIPYIREAIEGIADQVIYVPGKDITPALIKDADALIVRTRTLCNQRLLRGSQVQFIATATIGFDHIDTQYCREAGIEWTNAPGSNANSVAEYIESSLTLLNKRGVPLNQMTLGVIGAGNVGKLVAQKAITFGMKVLMNDPPRAAREGSDGFSTLEDITANCDIISFHTPLCLDGEYKTLHLADKVFFDSLQKQCIIINTSRGEVIETQSLLNAVDSGRVSDALIDVWENEPDINRELLKKAYIATPHIAGYSAEGKGNATRMALEGLCRHFHIEADFDIKLPRPRATSKALFEQYNDLVLLAYNPLEDTKRLKRSPTKFEEYRNNYPLRRETEFYYQAWDRRKA